MNRKLYKLIFNETLGMVVPAGENVRGLRKAASVAGLPPIVMSNCWKRANVPAVTSANAMIT